MTKAEAEKIVLELLPKLNPKEQTALNCLINSKLDESPLRIEVIDETHQKFNGEIYVKHKSGYYHIWKTLHKEVVKYYNNGEIPNDCFVHHNKKTEDGHWDRDKNNIEDLSIVTKAEHSAIHKERKIVIKPKKAVCAVCGKTFLVCKYKNIRCCSRHCGNILGHRNRKQK